MPKKEKAELTPQEKYQAKLQLETDLGRLQRQYQILERDRNAMQKYSGEHISKLGNVLRILKKEHKEILTDLGVAASENNARKDAQTVNRLNQLLLEHDQCKNLIKQEKGHLSEIEGQIAMVTKQLVDLKSKQVTDEQSERKVVEGRRTLEALENKLETATKRFCLILAENRNLRAEIDHLLKERAHFNRLWEKLITSLAQGKKYMIDLIEQATIAYDQREEWCQKLQALRTRAHSDLIAHTQEMRELDRRMDHDGKLEDFLSVKGQKRLMNDLEQKERRKREQQREELEKLLEKYREILNDIVEFTGETQVDSIAYLFVKQEEENYSLIKYISELNWELEFLSRDLADLRNKIDEQVELHEQRENQQTATIEKLKSKIKEKSEIISCDKKFQVDQHLGTKIHKDPKLPVLQHYADETETELKTTETKLGSLLQGIHKLFKICKCSNAPLLELLGDNTAINNYNVLLYLEMVEERVNELIMSVYYNEKTDKKKTKDANAIIKDEKIKYELAPIGEVVHTNPCPLCVEQEQVSDVIDTLQQVLNKEEIAKKLNEHLKLADAADVVHNVSACHLPKSREIIQRRYQ